MLLSVDSVTPPAALSAALFVAGIGLVVPPALSALALLLLLAPLLSWLAALLPLLPSAGQRSLVETKVRSQPVTETESVCEKEVEKVGGLGFTLLHPILLATIVARVCRAAI